MILVRRPATPASLDPSDPNSAGAKELRSARDLYNANGHQPPPVKNFKAYASEDVKDTLTVLFHGKCAYCESKVSGSSQTDIEHYRPKGGVHEHPAHPGYWWLAMQWENLVLSCMHCNQHRRQLNLSPDMSVDEIKAAIIANDRQTTGKKNAFPTEGDVYVTDPDGDLSTESPFLIDPTVTDPEPLFEWTDRASFAFALPKGGNTRADTTIKVLGLNRRWLCEQRMSVLAELILAMQSLRTMVIEIENATTDGVARIAQMAAKQHLDAIAAKCEAQRPHAAVARKFLAEARTLLAAVANPV